eukprot:4081315-Prymnesium_polylepis.1
MRATEFDFRWVYSGTNTPMPPLGPTYLSFFDVDGETDSSQARLREFVALNGARDQTIARTSSLSAGVFAPSEARYAIASQPESVDTDFTADPSSPATASLPAIVAFEVDSQTSHLKLVLGGRSSVAHSDR